MEKILNIILILLLGTGLYAGYKKTRLPVRTRFPAVALQEPKQTLSQRKPFTATVNGQTHTITPLFNYEISGMVVSRRFSKMLAEFRRDNLNIMDAGIIWGSNLNPDLYTRIKFHHNGVWLRYKTATEEVWQNFDENKVSNNHLLSTDLAVAKKINTLTPGDLITLKGVLASYTFENGSRGSSTVRTDKGNGACETIYVEDVTFLESGNRNWHLLYKTSLYTFFGLILMRLIRFFVVAHTA
jgi:hypothetical protein